MRGRAYILTHNNNVNYYNHLQTYMYDISFCMRGRAYILTHNNNVNYYNHLQTYMIYIILYEGESIYLNT